MRRSALTQRPEAFRVDPTHPLARGLIFANFGGGRGSAMYRDDSPAGRRPSGELRNMDPKSDWSWSQALGQWSLRTRGGDDYIYITGLSLLSGDVSICFWALPDNETSNAYISDFAGGNKFSLICGYQDGYYNAFGGDYPFGNDSTASRIPMLGNAEVWDHVCWTRDHSSSTLKGYVNGREYTSGTITHGDFMPAYSLYIGTHYAGGPSRYLGRHASYCIYNRVLTPTEIRTHANRADPMLSGMILPAKRRIRVPPSFAFVPAWAHGINQQIGTGLGV